MANILDYLTWRGDLLPEAVPYDDVDLLVLARMVYAPLDGVVPADFTAEPVPMTVAAAKQVALTGEHGDGRQYRIRDDEDLMKALAKSPRFAGLRLIGFVNRFNPNDEEQFSAVTMLLPGGGFMVAFRGTDGTVTGWKEDFNMAFSDAVPAQLDSVRYLEEAASHFDGKIMLMGHSKGGNLAVYSAAFCSRATQQRVVTIRNYDGPGFTPENLKKQGLQNVIGTTKTYLPQSSIIGMLLEHAEDFTIVESRSVGIYQHNIYQWEVLGGRFVEVDSRTNSSQFVDATMKEWVYNIPPELRAKMVNGFFEVLKKADVKMFSDAMNGKKTLSVIKAYGELDDETREILLEGFHRLRDAMKSSAPALLENLKMDVLPELPKVERVPVIRKIVRRGTKPAGHTV